MKIGYRWSLYSDWLLSLLEIFWKTSSHLLNSSADKEPEIIEQVTEEQLTTLFSTVGRYFLNWPTKSNRDKRFVSHFNSSLSSCNFCKRSVISSTYNLGFPWEF